MKKWIFKKRWTLRGIWAFVLIAIVILHAFFYKYVVLIINMQPEILGFIFVIISMIMIITGFFIWKPLSPTKELDSYVQDEVTAHPVKDEENYYLFKDTCKEDLKALNSICNGLKYINVNFNESISKLESKKKDAILKKANIWAEHVVKKIPKNLEQKVFEKFCFDGYVRDNRHNITRLFIKHHKDIIGMVILKIQDFSPEELDSLNKSWYPFIFIHPKIHYIRFGVSDDMKKNLERKTEEFFKLFNP